MFDAQSFLDAAVTQSNDTRIIPCPIGEYHGIINDVKPRQWQSKDGTQTGIALDVLWSIEDSGVQEFLGRKEVIVKQGIMLDINPNTGGLDMSSGKNVGLGRLREAVGLNEAGSPFAFNMLPGQSAKVSVNHRIAGDDTFAEVKATTRL